MCLFVRNTTHVTLCPAQCPFSPFSLWVSTTPSAGCTAEDKIWFLPTWCWHSRKEFAEHWETLFIERKDRGSTGKEPALFFTAALDWTNSIGKVSNPREKIFLSVCLCLSLWVLQMKWVSHGGAEFPVIQRTKLCNGYHLTSAVKGPFVRELTWSLCLGKIKKSISLNNLICKLENKNSWYFKELL